MSPLETVRKRQTLLKMIIEHLFTSGMNDSYHWNLQLNVMGRPTFINEKMITVVNNCVDANRRQTVRNIAEIVDISKTTERINSRSCQTVNPAYYKKGRAGSAV
jgi:hypothetical protein